ncbi:ribosome-associated heat shock protein Hsp15 [Catenovulum maritimum]|uniref:Heat shock protein 15 n=1 Tax=Catenovulum maritimum TaxID=1513271 RepID=A0A0J8GVA9_9ALTE|nr:ribosome-associated heat shock protein Hsp15 [Catenovulum maritimum]KMT64608.1 hypothetical protein XM47_13255 [Catenovulum maritimum]
MKHKSSSEEIKNPTRLDKWLWAARFYKTRAIAKSMVETGKVKYNQQKSKPSRSVEIGAFITVQQGVEIKQIEVLALSETRRSATEAQQLYQETQESIKKRTEQALQRKLQYNNNPSPETKPDKKQRRQLIQVKQQKV